MTITTTKQPKATTVKQPTATKFTPPSESDLQAFKDDLLKVFPKEFGKFFAMSDSKKQAARLKFLFYFLFAPRSTSEGIFDPIKFRNYLKINTASEKELEAIWRENKQKYNLDPRDPEFRKLHERPATLRGPDFVHELMRYAAITEDPRFSDAVYALVEHGIIDEKLNFKRWQVDADIDVNIDRNHLEFVCRLKEEGKSTRRACAVAAAFFGRKAASFAAAIKQLQLLYASAVKKGAA